MKILALLLASLVIAGCMSPPQYLLDAASDMRETTSAVREVPGTVGAFSSLLDNALKGFQGGLEQIMSWREEVGIPKDDPLNSQDWLYLLGIPSLLGAGYLRRNHTRKAQMKGLEDKIEEVAKNAL